MDYLLLKMIFLIYQSSKKKLLKLKIQIKKNIKIKQVNFLKKRIKHEIKQETGF